MPDISITFNRQTVSWYYSDDWTVSKLCNDIQSKLNLSNQIYLGLYGSVLDPNTYVLDTTLVQDIITVLDHNFLPTINLPDDYEGDPPKGHFRVYSTVTYESLTKGIFMPVSPDLDFDSQRAHIIQEIEKTYNIQDIDVIVYLPGAIPYLRGTINDFFSIYTAAKKVLYITVVSKSVSTFRGLSLPSYYHSVKANICAITNDQQKFCISPLNNLPEDTVVLGSALMGLLCVTDYRILQKIIGWFENNTKYAPCIIALHDIQKKALIRYHHIITITTTLFAIVKNIYNTTSINYSQILDFFKYVDHHSQSSPSRVTMNIAPFLNTSTGRYFFLNFSDYESISTYNSDFSRCFATTIKRSLPEVKDLNSSQSQIFREFKIIEAISNPNPMIIRGNNTFLLSLGTCYKQQDSKSIVSQKQIQYIDPKEGEIKVEVIDTMAEALRSKGVVIDTPSETQQINIICIDTSGSMGGTSLEIAKQCFKIIVNRAYEVGPLSLWGLYIFDTTPKIILPLSPIPNEFHRAVDTIRAWGCTALYRCIELAQDEINAKVRQKPEFKNAIKRIIALTDGGDNEYHYKTNNHMQELADIANGLVRDGIVFDYIELGDDPEYPPQNIAINSGGCYLQFSDRDFIKKGNRQIDITKIRRIFESDGFFNLTLRQFGPVKGNCVDRDMTVKHSPISIVPVKNFNYKQEELETLKKSIYLLEQKPEITQLENEILLNMKDCAIHFESQINKNFYFFIKKPSPNDEDKQFGKYWNVYMRTKKDSPYGANKWLKLAVIIPNGFPVTAPEIRFLSVPLHPNITADGSINIDVLRTRHNSNVTIFFALLSIRNMLSKPDFKNIQNMDVLERITPSVDLISIIRNSSFSEVSLPAYNEDSSVIVKLGRARTVKPKFCDPFSFTRMEHPVKASSGNYFEKQALIYKLSQSNGNLNDPINGQKIQDVKNTPEDLQFLGFIREYMKKYNVE
ncbi:Ubiquitin-conjugating enzyme family protein [Trichomonas vaginalis G3]|uniref:Ubiquitin-conjugating enzyme family protein n=2 Tax=Trichomonas vaginalis (strain ATCC PRA-98 / G3) TaxID=412133 RepID=A2F152_TRIV3|nr:protein modification by small protein conjugation [Trichomonas vaginalis G3]EAY01343.1 Ubiquitin-conjugating enzyme family protein [Trichomonas vaginalis G3]KAI5516698.1 protein modification by small protein conjugation [Trichomonas vaginalis G3]|eukprot:XP_001330196.1 Ubiquitin-conjugating enzyme family protein [Trichomonas vaginalis G3]